MNVLIFKNVWEKKPYTVSLGTIIERIKTGSSKDLIEKIRSTQDKKQRNNLKLKLPSIRFSVSEGGWTDESVEKHSGLICIDFDNLEDPTELKAELCCDKHVLVCFTSPSNDGLKALIRIPADLKKHRGYFKALQEYFKIESFDAKCINPSRICYESYDPDIWVNKKAEVFTDYIEEKTIEIKGAIDTKNVDEIFENLEKWMKSKASFSNGGRNHFIFTLACACKRNGLDIELTKQLCSKYSEHDFSVREIRNAVKSAYRKEQTQHVEMTK